ncbi:MAG: DEAD/DEAH box helicase family protein [Saccharospirillaceae bacterium]|nr:SNF2-related protein [Pseudomonadales bacterium]NRB80656.1 DEAD/DEAH box helicase family protein [Saccharospirillaceae bacterium]
MSNFVQGQRWVVDSEPELGLGSVVSSNVRTVTIFFSKSDEDRLYAIEQAPLTRIRFEKGETIQVDSGESLVINEVKDHEGFLFYDCVNEEGEEQLVPESALSATIELNSPLTRLITSQLDHPKWFRIRRQLNDGVQKVWQQQLNGLLGARAGLLAHQLYVAQQATELERTRVLLSDEVGLGKTIEAGLILSRLLRLERASHILILVPEALKVQWLVELMRRFSLTVQIWEQGVEIDEKAIYIASHDVLDDLEGFIEISRAQWDCIVVDETHHIEYTIDEPSIAYDSLDQMAQKAKHLILLSATPEQLGLEGHFGRLKLLDPNKFSDLDAYLKQEEQYLALTELINNIQDDALSETEKTQVSQQYGINFEQYTQDIVIDLVDRFGTGRGIFRNTRNAVKGFPKRFFESVELDALSLESDDILDAKLDWLSDWLDDQNKKDKHLLICHDLETTLLIEKYLWDKKGLGCAVFHEDLTLIERDRSAAFFADKEQGARIMLCSEIGSEGRNFQFCHNLICFDLPKEPDLLEQRIGRLDRIGQTQDIKIWIPSVFDSEEAESISWFNNVLNCIEQSNPAAGQVHKMYFNRYLSESDQAKKSEIAEEARQLSEELLSNIQKGRDKLLEISSCRQPDADALVQKIKDFETTTPLALLELAFDALNVHFEDIGNGFYSLQPSDNMLVPFVPGVPEDGAEVTFDRELALSRDEVRFITWDSPIVLGLLELLATSEIGTATLALFPSDALPPGLVLLEAMYQLSIQNPLIHQVQPFLAQASIRVVNLENNPKDFDQVLGEEKLQDSLTSVKGKLANQIVQSKKAEIKVLGHTSESLAKDKLSDLIAITKQNATDYYSKEMDRLKSIKSRYSSTQDTADIDENITQTQKRFDDIIKVIVNDIVLIQSSLRLIVTTQAK